MRFFFRVDASVEIGSGHVMRCLTLANELRDRGYVIEFICRELPGHMYEHITKQGYQVYLISLDERRDFQKVWSQDASECIKVIEGKVTDWIVVDHYELDYRWHQALRFLAGGIMVIDDLANRTLDCDLLLDQTYARCKDAYSQFVPTYCETLVGSEFALLRPEFNKMRSFSLDRRDYYLDIRHILVFLGGMDSHNISSKVIDALVGVDWQGLSVYQPKICIVLNNNAPYISNLINKINNINEKNVFSISLETNVNNMAELMANSDLAIGAAGSASWERCCLGLPTLSLILADNQQLIMEKLDEFGAVINLGWHNYIDIDLLSSLVGALCKDPQKLTSLTHCAKLVCDGLGVYRCADKIEEIYRR